MVEGSQGNSNSNKGEKRKKKEELKKPKKLGVFLAEILLCHQSQRD